MQDHRCKACQAARQYGRAGALQLYHTRAARLLSIECSALVTSLCFACCLGSHTTFRTLQSHVMPMKWSIPHSQAALSKPTAVVHLHNTDFNVAVRLGCQIRQQPAHSWCHGLQNFATLEHCHLVSTHVLFMSCSRQPCVPTPVLDAASRAAEET